MLIKKTDSGYFISGGREWIPFLPKIVKTKKDFEAHYRGKKDELSYADDNFKPAKLFEVYWWNGGFAQAKEDEDKTYVMNLPAYASDEQIIDNLKQRAKTLFNKEAVIHFTQARPEPPAEDNG